jgi:hypothetical protein
MRTRAPGRTRLGKRQRCLPRIARPLAVPGLSRRLERPRRVARPAMHGPVRTHSGTPETGRSASPPAYPYRTTCRRRAREASRSASPWTRGASNSRSVNASVLGSSTVPWNFTSVPARVSRNGRRRLGARSAAGPVRGGRSPRSAHAASIARSTFGVHTRPPARSTGAAMWCAAFGAARSRTVAICAANSIPNDRSVPKSTSGAIAGAEIGGYSGCDHPVIQPSPSRIGDQPIPRITPSTRPANAGSRVGRARDAPAPRNSSQSSTRRDYRHTKRCRYENYAHQGNRTKLYPAHGEAAGDGKSWTKFLPTKIAALGADDAACERLLVLDVGTGGRPHCIRPVERLGRSVTWSPP